MTKLVLDLTDPEVAAACGDHVVGDEKTLTVTGTVTKKTDKSMEIEVSDVAYSGDEPGATEPPADDSAAVAPPAPKAKVKKPSAPIPY